MQDRSITYHVAKNVRGILENAVGMLSLDVGDETDTARVLLVLGIVETLGNRKGTSPRSVALDVVLVHEGLHVVRYPEEWGEFEKRAKKGDGTEGFKEAQPTNIQGLKCKDSSKQMQ